MVYNAIGAQKYFLEIYLKYATASCAVNVHVHPKLKEKTKWIATTKNYNSMWELPC